MREAATDVLLVVSIATSTYVLVSVLLLLAAQLAGVERRVPWLRSFYVTPALWIAWVLVR